MELLDWNLPGPDVHSLSRRPLGGNLGAKSLNGTMPFFVILIFF